VIQARRSRDVARIREIPEHFNIVIGIGRGQSDPDRIINTCGRRRRPISAVVRSKEPGGYASILMLFEATRLAL